MAQKSNYPAGFTPDQDDDELSGFIPDAPSIKERKYKTEAQQPSKYKKFWETVSENIPNAVKSGWDTIWNPLTDLPSRAANVVAEPMMKYGESGDDWTRLPALYGGAFLQSLGDVTSGLTSPGNIALTIGTGGTNLAARAGLPKVAQALATTSKAAGVATGVHGGLSMLNPDASLLERGIGAVELAGGGLAARTKVPQVKSKVPKSASIEPPTKSTSSSVVHPIEDYVDDAIKMFGSREAALENAKRLSQDNATPFLAQQYWKDVARELEFPVDVPIKPNLEKPLPPLPVQENESVIDYLRRNGVDNIYTTPEEAVANRAFEAEKNLAVKENVTSIRADATQEPPLVPINKSQEMFDPSTIGFEGTVPKQEILPPEQSGATSSQIEFVDPTTGEIRLATEARPGDVPLIPPEQAAVVGPIGYSEPKVKPKRATRRMRLVDSEGRSMIPEFDDSKVDTVGHKAQNPPFETSGAIPPDVPFEPVGPMPTEQGFLPDLNMPPLRPAGEPIPQTPYAPKGVERVFGPKPPSDFDRVSIDGPNVPLLPNTKHGPVPPPPPTPYAPRGIPRQYGPKPPKQPPIGPKLPPRPPHNPPPPTPPPGWFRNLLNINKAALTAGDFSAPGRQGKAFFFNKAYWTSFDDMFKAFGSKQASDLVHDSIVNHPSGYFKPGKTATGGKIKSLAEQVGLDLPEHEEMFTGAMNKKFGGWIDRSSRAHTAFLNKLRSDQFASMMNDAKSAGLDPERNLTIAKAYAKFINDATGRGSVNIGKWKLERNMNVLNDVFFAPKNMSGQIRTWNGVLNPIKYANYDPVLRKQALKSLFAVAGLGLGVGELARLAGAQVSNDPVSSDFRKIKIGDTRIDPFGGYQQFPVAAMKFMSGHSTSTISNRETDLTAGRFGQRTRKDVAETFFTNRLSPLGSFVWAWMNNKEFDGKPFEAKRAIFERVFPIAAKDIVDLAKDDPALAAVTAIPTMFGLTGTQHYTGR